MVLKGHFGAIWAKFERVFLRKIDFCIYPILAQNGPEAPIQAQKPKIIVLEASSVQN